MGATLIGSDATLSFDIVINEQHLWNSEVTTHPVERGADVADHVRDDLDKVVLEVFISNEPIGIPVSSSGVVSLEDLLTLTPDQAISGLSREVPTPGKLGGPNDYLLPPGGARTSTTIPQIEYNPPFAPTPGAINREAVNLLDKGVGAGWTGSVTTITFGAATDFVVQALLALRRFKASVDLLTLVTPKWVYGDMILKSAALNRTASDGTGASMSLEFIAVSIVEVQDVPAPQPTELRAPATVSKGVQGTTPKQMQPARGSVAFKALNPGQ